MTRLRAIGLTIVGWALLIAGVVAIVLPGPGLLLILAGLVTLSGQHDWARRRVEPVRRTAFAVARRSVADIPQLLLSTTAAATLIAVGVLWWADPTIPEFWVFGPQLPLGGWEVGSGLILSGLVALALIGYSIVVFRSEPNSAESRRTAKSRPTASAPANIDDPP